MSEEKQVKTLYHGELRGEGEVEVTIKSDVLPSAKQKGKEYVTLEMHGRERYYTPENEACADALRGKKGKRVKLLAEGTREEASILVTVLGGQVEPEAEKPARRREQVAPPCEYDQPQTAPCSLDPAKRHVARNATLAKIALKAWHRTAAEYSGQFGEPLPPELYAPLFGTLVYGSAHLTDALPLDLDIATLKPRTGGAK